MQFRELSIPGAWEITPHKHSDTRGEFFEWFTTQHLTKNTGDNFDVQQTNCSVSAAGVLRGLHFAQLPPGQAKYITCVQGAIFDVVVDIRRGSPTYGRWDCVLLNASNRKSVYLRAGLAHGFLALQDDSTVMYLCSAPYTPQREHTIDATDPAIGITWPLPPSELVTSRRDAQALTLKQVEAAGLLPTWNESDAIGASEHRH